MATTIINYEDFLNKEDTYKFECDMEKGKFKEWIEKYPQHTLSIFGSLLSFYGNLLKEEDIVYFTTKGVDLNLPSKVYLNIPSKVYTLEMDKTPLTFACEHRHLNLVRHLLKLGVNVNQRDSKGFSPLEIGLMGHGLGYISKIDEVEHLVKLLMEYKVEKEIKKFVLEDFCEYYLNNSYLSEVLNSCKIIQ